MHQFLKFIFGIKLYITLITNQQMHLHKISY